MKSDQDNKTQVQTEWLRSRCQTRVAEARAWPSVVPHTPRCPSTRPDTGRAFCALVGWRGSRTQPWQVHGLQHPLRSQTGHAGVHRPSHSGSALCSRMKKSEKRSLSVNAQRRGVPGLKGAHGAAAPIPQVSIHASVPVCMCVHTPVPRLSARSPCPYTTSPDSSSEDHEKNEPPTSSEASGSFPGDPWRQSVSSCSCIPRPCCCQINFTKVEDAPVTATALSEY